jgi:hypothetical protein
LPCYRMTKTNMLVLLFKDGIGYLMLRASRR